MKYENAKIGIMTAGATYDGVYVIKEAVEKVASNNEPYVSVVLMDATGEIQGNLFNSTLDTAGIKAGDFVKAELFVSFYKEKLQFKFKWFNKIQDISNINLSDFVRSYPYKNEAYNNILKLIGEIKDFDIQDLCLYALGDMVEKIKEYPAAKTYHHNYNGGLIEHTNNMMILARNICSLYRDINKNYVYAGILFHDLMKIEEYVVNNLSIVEEYSTKGRLLGHISIGILYVEKIFNIINSERINEGKSPIESIKLEIIQHLILSHHGELEYGSPVKPACKEAMLIHEIDMIDSRMSMFREAEKDIESGTFSDYKYELGGKVYKI